MESNPWQPIDHCSHTPTTSFRAWCDFWTLYVIKFITIHAFDKQTKESFPWFCHIWLLDPHCCVGLKYVICHGQALAKITSCPKLPQTSSWSLKKTANHYCTFFKIQQRTYLPAEILDQWPTDLRSWGDYRVLTIYNCRYYFLNYHLAVKVKCTLVTLWSGR